VEPLRSESEELGSQGDEEAPDPSGTRELDHCLLLDLLNNLQHIIGLKQPPKNKRYSEAGCVEFIGRRKISVDVMGSKGPI
jgi:hypothetical protein